MEMEERKEYQELNEKIDAVLSLPQEVVAEESRAELHRLKQAIQQDVFSIVVLGEFSRGKSTFVNALMGEPLLPMDVLPETAVIQVLHYAEQPGVEIVYRNGMVKQGEADCEFLKRFSVRAQQDTADDVEYLRIGYPSSFLQHQVVVVDTPGVSDMDEQRAEVTYGFLPQADMVLFLLDASSPLKKTEKEFLEKRVLPQGIRKIVFLANKIDHLDEEEVDEEEYLDKLRMRLKKAFGGDEGKPGLQDIELFPLSAWQALKGGAAEKRSGMAALRAYLEQAAEGQRMTIKLARFQWQYRQVVQRIYNQALSRKMLHETDSQQLEAAKKQIEAMLADKEQGQERVQAYMEKEQKIILDMTNKSLKHFYQRLEEDILDMVENYRGDDFKDFIESRIIKRVQREIDNWIGMYGPRILLLIRKVELQISRGMSRNFQQEVMVESSQLPFSLDGCAVLDVRARDLSNTDLQAGAIAAAGGVGLTLVAGGVLMPFISFAAMPFIRKTLFQKRLAAAKAEVTAQLSGQLIQCMNQLQKDVQEEIRKRCTVSVKNIVYSYESLLADYRDKIDAEIREKTMRQRQLTSSLEADKQVLETLGKLQIQGGR